MPDSQECLADAPRSVSELHRAAYGKAAGMGAQAVVSRWGWVPSFQIQPKHCNYFCKENDGFCCEPSPTSESIVQLTPAHSPRSCRDPLPKWFQFVQSAAGQGPHCSPVSSCYAGMTPWDSRPSASAQSAARTVA